MSNSTLSAPPHLSVQHQRSLQYTLVDQHINYTQAQHTIDLIATEYNVRNPRTGQDDFSFTTLDHHAFKQLNHTLRYAQVEWYAKGIEHRCRVFLAWHKAVIQARDHLIEALSIDTGRYHESVLEVDLLIQSIEQWTKIAPPLLQQISTTPTQVSNIKWIDHRSHMLPYPLVAVISPWNFPLLLACIDALPALMAGCAVMLKPSEITPRFIEPLMKTIREVDELAGVFSVVYGGGEMGRALVSCADFVCFTGSVATGKKVAQACSQRLIAASLELGGKDPAILLPQTDLQRAVPALVWGSMVNAGQSCLSIERVYVHESQFDECLTLMQQHIAQLQLNDKDMKAGQIGPVIAHRQAEIHQQHLQDAIALGAHVHVGGEVVERQGGLYCLPTLLSQVSHTMQVMHTETFGPILPVMTYQDIEQAIQWANATQYGLSAAILGPQEEETLYWAQFLACGAISVNDAALTSMVHGAEKQAFKDSGLGGSRMGIASIRRFMRAQALLMNRADHGNPWWFV